MIPRRLQEKVQNALLQFPAVAILGPRQVGKTTLAKHIWTTREIEYLDLENPADLAKLEDPLTYLKSRKEKLLIIDEIQRRPKLFQVLRGVIDERVFAEQLSCHFLLLGSASLELLKQSSESLAGRIAYLELNPLEILEISPELSNSLWLRGGFPRSFLADNDAHSRAWRNHFILTYIERDIPQLGPKIPSETLRRLWTMLAHQQGSLLNAAQLARSLAVSGKTIANYLDLMVDLLLVRRLPSYQANLGKRLVKSPKVYLRDSGLLHSLLSIETFDQLLAHPVVGGSWEGFIIENLLRAAPESCQASFYRSAAGAEIDLLLELPGNQVWAIEIKRGHSPKVEKGFQIALNDLKPHRALIVYSGNERYPKKNNIEVISLTELAQELSSL